MCGLTGFFLSNKSMDRNKLIKNLNEMKSALIHRGPDAQNIWIGGECGQVIKIVSISELTGGVVRYRIVSPDSGKILSNTTYNDDLISDSEKQGDVQESIDVEQHHIDDIISDDDAD